MAEEKEAFLSRWSRRKREAEIPSEPAVPAEPALPPAVAAGPAAAPQQPALPPIESINVNTDISPYLQAKVDQGLKQLALKKLFQDPHFHFASMDKLDIYIDDYSIPDPLPEGMLEQLKFVQDYLIKDPTKADVPGNEGDENQSDEKVATALSGEAPAATSAIEQITEQRKTISGEPPKPEMSQQAQVEEPPIKNE